MFTRSRMLCEHLNTYFRSSFSCDQRGAAAIEFGLIGGMLILLTCFWIELGLTLFMQATLDNAVRKEARLLRTGQITASGAATFKSNLCSDLSVLMSCTGVQVNVVSAATFAALSSSATVASDASSRMTTTGFSPGGSGADVVVQVGYTRSLFIPIVGDVLGKNGTLLIYSAVAFQNEPY